MTKESSGNPAATTAVQVALRIRPLTDRDRAQPRFANLSNDDVLKLFDKTVQVVPQNKLFTFDHVFGIKSTQGEVFTALGDNLIRKFIEGYNITILAYGQTSSGKTYTMGTAANGPGSNPQDEGIVPRSMALLFDLLHGQNNDNPIRPITPISSISSSTSTSNKSNSRLRPKSRISNRSSHIPHVPSSNNTNTNTHKTKFTVKVSFIEIYNEDLHDLLNSAPAEELPPITIREDTKGRIYWTGVKEVTVHSTDDVLYHLEQGTQNRATGATDMNEKSSRSHAIFSVSLKQEKWVSSDISQQQQKKLGRPQSSLSMRSSTTNNNTNSRLFNATNSQAEEGEWLITTSKFHFVDLAGSERLKRTAAEGDRRKEGININAGLLALGNVISALGDPSKKNFHVPYRDSKLTRLLQDSLGGTATTLMIACASPAEYNLAETLNTLQYANRARNIKNRSEKNQVEEWMTTENIELLRSLIGKLKNELNYLKTRASTKGSQEIMDDDSTSSSTPSLEDTYHEQRLLIADLQRQVEELDGEASVTRECNRMVEKELQRMRLLESMTAEQVDFQHLVEPVIEEYEKSVAKLESQLAMTKAALTHADMGYEEQQAKLTQLEGLVRQQEQTISELRLRLSKVLEREQSNEGYIQELESKLMKSAHETTKDQEMLNELKNRIMKLKETDENTEQYINSLEQRLAAGDAERTRLRTSVEELEAKIEAKERTNVELLKRLSKSTSDTNTEKMILKELDEVNAKYTELEKERDSWQQQINVLKEENHRISTAEATNYNNESSNNYDNALSLLEEKQRRLSSSSSSSTGGKKSKNRKSLADENATASSVAALNLLQTEARLKEESDRANHLQKTLDRLQYDHSETVKELDEVLQRYQETLEQLDFLERESTLTADAAAVSSQDLDNRSLDLSKEIAQAKEDAHAQEKQEFVNQVADLQHRVQSLTKKIAIKDSELEIANESVKKLEQELDIANKQVYILKQMESEHKATVVVEQILDDLNVNRDITNEPNSNVSNTEDLKILLANEKKQVSHWKLVHSELQQDMEKLTLDLDGKEQYISQLKEKLDSEDLRAQLEKSNQQSTSLQKRLAETLASLTVLKIAHDSLQKKLQQERGGVIEDKITPSDTTDVLEKELEKYNREKSELLETHQSELAQVQHSLETKLQQINETLRNTTSDKDNAIQKLSELENQLKTQRESTQNDHYMEQEKMLETHKAQIMNLTDQHETSSTKLKNHAASLEQELDASKAMYDKALQDHDLKVKQLTQDFDVGSQRFIDRIAKLELELENSKSMHEQVLLEHDAEMMDLSKNFESATREMEEQISELESELEASKDLHEEILLSHKERIRDVAAATRKEERERSKAVQDKLQQHVKMIQSELELHKQETINSHIKNVNEIKAEHDQLCQTLQKQVEDLQLELKELKMGYSTQLHDLSTQHENTLKDQTNKGRILLDQLEEQLQKLKAENNQLSVTLKKKQEVCNVLEAKLANLPTPAPANNSSERVAEKIAFLEAQLAKNESEQQVQQQHDAAAAFAQTEVESLKNQLQEERQTLSSALENAKRQERVAQHRLAELEEHQVQTEKATAKRQQELKDFYETKLNRLTTTHDALSRQLATALEENKQQVTNKEQITTAALEAEVLELTQDLRLLRTSHAEKQQQIQEQRIQLEKQTLEIETLSEEINKLQFAANINNAEDKNKLYKDRISQLETQLKQTRDENLEYTSLSEELDKEINRITQEMEGFAEDLDASEDMVHQYQTKFDNIKTVLGVNDDNLLLKKIKEYVKSERSAMSTKLASAGTQDRSSGNNNDTLLEAKTNDGSGALSQQHGPSTYSSSFSKDSNTAFGVPTSTAPVVVESQKHQEQVDQLKKELQQCQSQMKNMVTRDEMLKSLEDLEKQQKQQLDSERQKLEQSEKARKRLEKQLEELLLKKSSFLCF